MNRVIYTILFIGLFNLSSAQAGGTIHPGNCAYPCNIEIKLSNTFSYKINKLRFFVAKNGHHALRKKEVRKYIKRTGFLEGEKIMVTENNIRQHADKICEDSNYTLSMVVVISDNKDPNGVIISLSFTPIHQKE